MGGKILEFSADKYYNAGKADGVTDGEQKFADLLNAILESGNTEDLVFAARDKEYRSSLYHKYAIA